MSFWGHLVSSLSDGGKAFLESTKKDIADFSSSLKAETKDLHLLPQGAGEAQRGGGGPDARETQADTQGGGEAQEGAGGKRRSAGDGVPRKGESVPVAGSPRLLGPPSSSPTSASSSSSLSSSLGLGLDRWSGNVSLRQLLPSFIASDSTAPASAPSSSASSSSPSSTSSSSYLRLRSTYAADPIDPLTSAPLASYSAFKAAFHAESQVSSSPYSAEVAGLLRHPSVQGFHSELVDGGEVDETAFWCRLFFARQRAEEEERKRVALQSRLSSLHQARAQQTGGDKDDLAWGDDEEEEVGRVGERAEGQGQSEERTGESAEAAVDATTATVTSEAAVPSAAALPTAAWTSSAPPLSSSFSTGGRSASDADPSVAAAALFALEAASPSPASSEGSEGSGELVDRAELLEDIRRQGGGEGSEGGEGGDDGEEDKEGDERRRDGAAGQPSLGEEDYDEWE